MIRQNALTLTVIAASLGLGGVLFSQIAVKHFNPPRTAIVDTFEVIEKYKKKEVLENELRARVESATQELEGLEREYKRVEAELKLIGEGSEEHRRMVLRKTELGLQLQDLNIKIRKQLEETRDQAITQIRQEVEAEIENYARSHDLDVVVEKKIPIEGPKGVKINIPIVRYVKPEIEITREVTQIINDRYSRVLQGTGSTTAPPSTTKSGRP